MFFLFRLAVQSSPLQNTYRGNWTANITLTESNISIIEGNSFQIDIEQTTNNSTVYGIMGRAIFRNTTHVSFPAHHLSFSGIALENGTRLFMFCLPNVPPLNSDKSLALIYDAAKQCNQTDFKDLELIYKTMYMKNQRFFSSYQLIGIIINMKDNLATHYTFDSKKGITGALLWDLPVNLTFQGSLFNLEKYIVEGKKFGVLTGITVLLVWYAWESLSKNMASLMSLGLLSVHSFIMQIGFDFSYSLFVFDFSMQAVEFLGLYSFLFVCMVSIYFVVQMKQLALIWRANHADINDVQPDALRLIFLKFFAEVSVLMALISISVSAAFDFPYICLPFLYSFFIPQIVHSAKTPGKKKGDEIFIIFTAIQKLFPVWYFSSYKKNILECDYPLAAILCTIFVGIQVIILFLQNRFGGAFFLPKRMRPSSFDYHSLPAPPNSECAICMTPIEDGDDIMVTPCHHAFHTECLTRWMEEQLVCPFCRSTLPPIGETTV